MPNPLIHLLNTKQAAKGDTPSDQQQLLEMNTPHISNLSLGKLQN